MTEEEQGISSVEQKRVRETNQPSFGEKIRSLIEPGKEGEVITDESLLRLAELALLPRNQTPERLEELLKKGDDLFAEGKVPKEKWAILAGVIEEELERLRASSPKEPSLGAKVGELVDQIATSQRQTQELAESLRRLPSDAEKARWIDAEYRQEFYTRFTPTLEPRFYTCLLYTSDAADE